MPKIDCPNPQFYFLVLRGQATICPKVQIFTSFKNNSWNNIPQAQQDALVFMASNTVPYSLIEKKNLLEALLIVLSTLFKIFHSSSL